MTKEELYKRIEKVLSEYENDDNKDVYDNLQDLSSVLTIVKNNWNTLTN